MFRDMNLLNLATRFPEGSGGKNIETLPEWDLSGLYDGINDSKINNDREQLSTWAEKLNSTYHGKIRQLAEQPDGAEKINDLLEDFEKLSELMTRLATFAQLNYCKDTLNQENAMFFGNVSEFLDGLMTKVLFINLELNQLDDDTAKGLVESKALKRLSPWLRDIRLDKPHQLEERLEQYAVDVNSSCSEQWGRLFHESIAEIKFDIPGEKESLRLEEVLDKMLDKDGMVRKNAAKSLSKGLQTEKRLITTVFNVTLKNTDIDRRWRKFEHVTDMRHLSNRVERDVVEALVSAVRASYGSLSHRYYHLKAKMMGQDVLDYWDRLAPLSDEKDEYISFSQARSTVLDAFSAFDPAMADIAGKFFDHGWIDAAIRPGKASGAFSHPGPCSQNPFVLVNYLGKPRDVMTLAHELGHGVHQFLASKQGALMAPTPLTLAETASVFGEMLVFRALQRQISDPVQNRNLLAKKVEDMLATVVRQIAFFNFELKLHEARTHGELSFDTICELWMSVQSESLGPAIRFDDDYKAFWMYVSHFVDVPFYVYAYAFGDCLVNSLFGLYEQDFPNFRDHYFDLLRAGGSRPYAQLLSPFGLNPQDPAFWQVGLNVISGMIDQLEGMVSA